MPMGQPSILEQIRLLDPVQDHQRIVFLCCRHEFPFDTTRALEFALFRTFCVPSVSALLDQTGEFQARPQKRYDDTDLIVSEMMEWGYDSERGKRALRRMNQIHGRFAIANDDFLYVLSTFIFEPIRWNARFGWRAMCSQEKLALFYFWREVGRRMNIQNLPVAYEDFERWNIAYEQTHYQYTPSNRRIGQATLDLFAGWFPRLVRPLVRQVMLSLMDEPVRRGFGFSRPWRLMRWLTLGGLKCRGLVVRWLPARRRPSLRTEMAHPSYPQGYRIEELGPPQSPADGRLFL